MTDDIRDSILPAIRKLAGAVDGPATADSELLRRWVQAHDESAFELLVWRHAALVHGICRQLLRDAHTAEDAFQATFLVLVRKAGAISKRDSLPAWLHRVAFRVALRARSRAQPGRLAGVEPLAEDVPPSADLHLVLHEEVSRLPAKYRLPVVLCYLQGKTHEEAAVELGWPRGTVAGRVARARDLLRRRLARRGVKAETALSGVGTAGAAWSTQAEALLRVVRDLSTNPSAVALAEGVIREMFWSKIRWSVLGVLSLALVGLVAAYAATRPASAEKEAQKQDAPKNEEDVKKESDPVAEAMDRARVRRQLRAIGAALLSYHEAHGHFPPPAILDRDGKPLLSWRVAILPYLKGQPLADRLRFDEPWDSEHNKKWLDRIPEVFAPLGKSAKANQTYYQYLVGPTAVFPDRRMRSKTVTRGSRPGENKVEPVEAVAKLPLAPSYDKSFTDGTDNTLLVVEAGSAVEWTRPDDVDYDPKKPLPKLGGQFAELTHALTAAGTVHALPKRLGEKTMRAAITPAEGEELDLTQVAGGPGAQARADAIKKLRERNKQLKEDAADLKDTLTELREEVRLLGWAVERERLLKADPDAAAIVKENTALEASLKEARDEVKKLLLEVTRLKKQLDSKPKQ